MKPRIDRFLQILIGICGAFRSPLQVRGRRFDGDKVAAEVLSLEPRRLLTLTGTVTVNSMEPVEMPPGARPFPYEPPGPTNLSRYIWDENYPADETVIQLVDPTEFPSSIVDSPFGYEGTYHFRLMAMFYNSGVAGHNGVKQVLTFAFQITLNTNYGNVSLNFPAKISIFQDITIGSNRSGDKLRTEAEVGPEIQLGGGQVGRVYFSGLNYSHNSPVPLPELIISPYNSAMVELIGKIYVSSQPTPPDVKILYNGQDSTYVQMGIWNNAYDQNGQLKNGSSADKNFIDLDSRHFRIQVTDNQANEYFFKADKIVVEVYVVDAEGKTVESRTSNSITLVETGLDTGIFESRGLMLVARDIDARVDTHAGVEETVATWGTANHRLRLAGLNDRVIVKYDPAGNFPLQEKSATVFKRGPEDERRILDLNVVRFVAWKDKNKNGVYDNRIDVIVAEKKDRKKKVAEELIQFLTPRAKIAKELWTPAGLDVRWNPKITAVPLPKPMSRRSDPFSPDFVLDSTDAVLKEQLIDSVLKFSTVAPNSMTVMLTSLDDVAGVWTPLNKSRKFYGPDDSQQDYSQFVFINKNTSSQAVLAHELFHALYNKYDQEREAVPAQYFTFNTSSVIQPTVLEYSRIHPHTIDWVRTIPLDPYDSVGALQLEKHPGTGNHLVRPYTP